MWCELSLQGFHRWQLCWLNIHRQVELLPSHLVRHWRADEASWELFFLACAAVGTRVFWDTRTKKKTQNRASAVQRLIKDVFDEKTHKVSEASVAGRDAAFQLSVVLPASVLPLHWQRTAGYKPLGNAATSTNWLCLIPGEPDCTRILKVRSKQQFKPTAQIQWWFRTY